MFAKRLALLMLAGAVLAGCGAAPATAPAPTAPVPGAATPAASTADSTPAPDADRAPEVDQAPAVAPTPAQDTTPAQDPPPAAPAPATPIPATPIPATPVVTAPAPTPSASALVRVPTPAAGALPAAIREIIMQRSPWEVAQNAAYWLYGGKPYEGPFVAPALVAQVATPVSGSQVDTLWTQWAKDWEQDGHFYFQVQMTGQQANGRLTRLGVAVVEVSRVEGSGYVATGYSHTAWPSSQSGSPISIWANGPAGPVEMQLQAKTVARGSSYFVPLEAVAYFGPLYPAGASAYTVELAQGQRSNAFATEQIGGVPYVEVNRLIAALDGAHGAFPDASGAYSVHIDWRTDLQQLWLQLDTTHRSS